MVILLDHRAQRYMYTSILPILLDRALNYSSFIHENENDSRKTSIDVIDIAIAIEREIILVINNSKCQTQTLFKDLDKVLAYIQNI